MAPIFAVGDVHGEYDKLVALLRGAGLLSEQRTWGGADAALWFMGDLVNNGPEGVPVLDLVMALRETEGSRYTLRDTPIFTCLHKSLKEALDTLGG